MWMNGQTLRHKVTNKVARLATRDDGAFAWDIGKDTRFIDKDGKKFTDSSSNWTHIEDEFGQAACLYQREGEFIHPDMIKYTEMDETQKVLLRDKAYRKQEEVVLSTLFKDDYMHIPFPKRSGGRGLQTWFLARRNSMPLHRSKDSIYKKFNTKYCRQYIFWLNDKLYMFDTQMTCIKLTDITHMLHVANKIKRIGGCVKD
jgi:hypothetical protein